MDTQQTRFNSQLRILLVEDHTDTRELLARLLIKDGYDVQTAGSSAAAIEKGATGEFNLLLCDVGLPDGSGIDLLRQLRAFGPMQGIVLTGYGMDADIESAHRAGYAKHLLKPIDYRKVREAIDLVQSILTNATRQSDPPRANSSTFAS